MNELKTNLCSFSNVPQEVITTYMIPTIIGNCPKVFPTANIIIRKQANDLVKFALTSKSFFKLVEEQLKSLRDTYKTNVINKDNLIKEKRFSNIRSEGLLQPAVLNSADTDALKTVLLAAQTSDIVFRNGNGYGETPMELAKTMIHLDRSNHRRLQILSDLNTFMKEMEEAGIEKPKETPRKTVEYD